MALRVEYIVVFITIVTLSFSLLVDIKKEQKTIESEKKDLQFGATIFREVDRNATISSAFAVSGVRVNDVLKLKKIKFSNNDISYLIGDRSTYENSVIVVEGNVKMLAKNGLYCETQKARYIKKTRVIDLLEPFEGTMNQNKLIGDSLRYYIDEKRVFVENPIATIHTK